jgi:hypothetical protein
MRRFFLLIPPLIVGAFNLAHPIVHSSVYSGILHHLNWWIGLHVLNLFGFPLVGLAVYLLTQGMSTIAATVSRIAAAIFIPTYAAFDALAGIGTGTLVKLVSTSSPDQSAVYEPIVAAYWNSSTIMAIAIVGSIAWTIAMLSAAIAVAVPRRRGLVAVVSLIIFFIIGWARGNLMSADGATISIAWWFVLAAVGLAMLAASQPRVPCALLVLAAALFGAAHIMPAGPLGLASFFGAAVFTEFFKSDRAVEPVKKGRS